MSEQYRRYKICVRAQSIFILKATRIAVSRYDFMFTEANCVCHYDGLEHRSFYDGYIWKGNMSIPFSGISLLVKGDGSLYAPNLL